MTKPGHLWKDWIESAKLIFMWFHARDFFFISIIAVEKPLVNQLTYPYLPVSHAL